MKQAIGPMFLTVALLGCGAAQPGSGPRGVDGAREGEAESACDCDLACLCQGVEPSPEQIEEARRASDRCEAADTPCDCPLCDAQ